MNQIFEFSLNSKALRDAVAKVPAIASQEFRQALSEIGAAFMTSFADERLSGRPGLEKRTGRLYGSIDYRLKSVGANHEVMIGFYGAQSPWVNIHETGGTITANGNASQCGKGKYLAIPLGANKTANQHNRARPCDFKKKGKDGLQVIRSKRGNLLLVQIIRPPTKGRRTKGSPKTGVPGLKMRSTGRRKAAKRAPAKIIPMFVLKKQVTIPARLGFREAWERFRSRAGVRMDMAFRSIIAKAVGGGAK